MSDQHAINKIFAQALWEIQSLLHGYLGNEASGDLSVRQAAHLSFALQNEALAVLEGKYFDAEQAIIKIKVVDEIFDENFSVNFAEALNSEQN